MKLRQIALATLGFVGASAGTALAVHQNWTTFGNGVSCQPYKEKENDTSLPDYFQYSESGARNSASSKQPLRCPVERGRSPKITDASIEQLQIGYMAVYYKAYNYSDFNCKLYAATGPGGAFISATKWACASGGCTSNPGSGHTSSTSNNKMLWDPREGGQGTLNGGVGIDGVQNLFFHCNVPAVDSQGRTSGISGHTVQICSTTGGNCYGAGNPL